MCGMEVSFDNSDPRRPRLLVSPGYAVNCCGDDIVACPPHELEVCPSIREYCRKSGQNDQTKIVADVWVYPHEIPLQPEVARRTGACSPDPICEYSRAKESAVALLKPATEVPRQDDCELNTSIYNNSVDIIKKVIDQLPNGGEAVREVLKKAAANMRQFYFISEEIETAETEKLVNQKFLAQLLLPMFK